MDSTSLIFKRRPIAAGHKREEKQIAEEEKEREVKRERKRYLPNRALFLRVVCVVIILIAVANTFVVGVSAKIYIYRVYRNHYGCARKFIIVMAIAEGE